MKCCGSGDRKDEEAESSKKEKKKDDKKGSEKAKEDDKEKHDEEHPDSPGGGKRDTVFDGSSEHAGSSVYEASVDVYIDTWEKYGFHMPPAQGRRVGREPPHTEEKSEANAGWFSSLFVREGKDKKDEKSADEDAEGELPPEVCCMDQISVNAASDVGKVLTEKKHAEANQQTLGLRTYGGPWVAGYPGDAWTPKGAPSNEAAGSKQRVLEAFAAIEAKSRMREDLLGAGLESQRADLLGFWPALGVTEIEDVPPPPSAPPLESRKSMRSPTAAALQNK